MHLDWLRASPGGTIVLSIHGTDMSIPEGRTTMGFRDQVTHYLSRGDAPADGLGLYSLLRDSSCYEFTRSPVNGGEHVVIAGGDRPREFCLELIFGQALATQPALRASMAYLDGDGGVSYRWTLSTRAIEALYDRAATAARS